jgi:predicted nucleotidyltransferase component of viral defense system
MKEEALALMKNVMDPASKLNLLREYLQEFVLRSLHESEAFLCLSFVGGSALRFLYELPRFSEDLDFSLERAASYQPAQWLGKLKRDFALAGFDATIRWNDRKIVHVVWIRISGILHQVRLAAVPEQKLSVKLEINTRPPEGAVLQSRLVNRHMIFALRHHDISSLMAGKIHALTTRRYPKGRDWYDLLWYRSRRPPVEPNLTLLKSALAQTEGERAFPAETWSTRLLGRLRTIQVESLARDVRPFLERPQDAGLLTPEYLRSILQEAAVTP